MENIVSVKYEKIELFPVILVNGEQISRYMTLTNYIYDNALKWVDIFFESMDDELGESYTVELVGHKFHEILFNEAMKQSKYCSKIVFVELKYSIPIFEKFEYILKLNETYNVLQLPSEEHLKFACDEELTEQLNGLGSVVLDNEETQRIICKKDSNDIVNRPLTILISDAFSLKKDDVSLVLEIEESNLPVLLDYLNIYELYLKVIADFSSLSQRARLPEEVKAELDAVLLEKMKIVVNDLPETIDVGADFEPQYTVFPKVDNLENKPIIVSNRSDIVAVDNGKLVGIAEGNAIIRFLDDKGNEIFASSIKCIKHNYVKNITVILNAISIKIGDYLNFKVVLTPENADDKNDVQITVSDEKIAVLVGDGTLYGISAGRVCVTVATKHVEKKFYIDVTPKLTGLVVARERLSLSVNSIASFGCSYYPAQALPIPSVKWETSNSRIVAIEKSNGFEVVIKTLAAGRAVVTCMVVGEESIKKEVVIEVR